MCATCGCSGALHEDLRPELDPKLIKLEHDVLHHNDHVASHLREHFAERGILALNLVSSPGSGKTTLLESTIRALREEFPLRVIEGDQETSRDADRIRAAGATAVQINTGTACHLEAETIHRALHELDPPDHSVLFIENVGNLVCPALFDLGERARVVVSSVTEGEDKPIKYPHLFRTSQLVLLNKVDLLPYVPFSVDRFQEHLSVVNPRAKVIGLSALRGEGLEAWHAWIRFHRQPEART